MTDDFLEKLTELQKEIKRDYKDINKGGCAFFAKECAKVLKKFNIDFEIVVFDYRKKEELKEVIAGKHPICDIEDSSVEHVALKIDNHIFDGTDKKADREFNKIKAIKCFTISLKDLNFIEKNGLWNKSFRTVNKPKIRKLIRQKLIS